MAIKVCTGTTSQPFVHVQARLSQPCTITATGLDAPLVTDSTGVGGGTYSISLWAASDLTPTGTYYTITEFLGSTDNTFNVQVPASAGPFAMSSILVGTPTASASPNHVSTLIVDGTSGVAINAAGDIAARSVTVSSSSPYTNTLPGNAAVATPAGVVAGKFYDWLGEKIDVKAAGAKGDGLTVADAAITISTSALTSATAGWTSADVGKLIRVEGAGVGTISAFVSSTAVTVSFSASATVTNAVCIWGTDDATAINTAITAASAGWRVFFSPGLYMVSSTIVADGPVLLEGTDLDYSTVDLPIRKGSVLVAGAAMASVLQLGSDPNSSVSGKTGTSAYRMGVDGANLATAALKTAGRRNYVSNCQIWRGATYGCDLSGQNSYLLHSVIGMNNTGSVVRINNSDVKVALNQIRQGGVAQLEINNTSCIIEGNHLFGGANGSVVGTTGDDILIRNLPSQDEGDMVISGNTIEGTFGNHINIQGTAAIPIGRITITGNVFYQITGFPDNTYAVVRFDTNAAASIIRQVTINGNTFRSTDGSHRYTALADAVGTGANIDGISITGNVGQGAVAIYSGVAGFRPSVMLGNVNRVGTTNTFSDFGGLAAFNGDGATTAFTIPHRCGAAPLRAVTTPASVAAEAAYKIGLDATNITVTFAVAPGVGTSNVQLYWNAWL